MRRNVSTFVVRVNSHVQTHQFTELFVVVPQHVGKVSGPIQLGIWLNVFAPFVRTSVDVGRNTRKARNQIHRIFIRVLPVLGLADPARIGLAKL